VAISYRPSRAFKGTLATLAAMLLVLLIVRAVVLWDGSSSPVPAPRPVVASTAPDHAPPATVPAPRRVGLAGMPAPFPWTRSSTQPKPLRFQVDLDLLAPLGDGRANAAIWFRDFARADGSRSAWGDDKRVIRKVAGVDESVFPPDHPVLLEAEPWVDQATMRFYPDIWPVAGPETNIPNLLFAITLAKSWAARAETASDSALAREDYRRAVRLGRLILQDDVTLISNLVGLACVRIGARGLYEQARREGDAETMLAASLALHDADAIRQIAAERTTTISVPAEYRWHWSRPFQPTVRATDEQFEAALTMAKADPSRALRLEGQFALMGYVAAGTRAQGRQARATLEELSRDPDPLVASSAQATLEAADRIGWRELLHMLKSAS
jgi:hypothetical protein